MSKRGTIMRDPSAGPGLVMVQGQQFHFALEGVWKTETLPRPGLVVDVDFDPAGQVSGITPVPEGKLATEQAKAALQRAREESAALAHGMVARFGVPRLVAAAALVLGWCVLSTVSIDAGFLGQMQVTFWQVLGLVNVSSPMDVIGRRGGPGAGLYGVVALACMAGPFLTYFWKDARAHLAGLLPLALMLIVAVVLYSKVSSALGAGSEFAGGLVAGAEFESMYGDMQRQARAEAMKAVSIGAGAYLSVLASLYFAAVGLKGYLVRRATDRAVTQE